MVLNYMKNETTFQTGKIRTTIGRNTSQINRRRNVLQTILNVID